MDYTNKKHHIFAAIPFPKIKLTRFLILLCLLFFCATTYLGWVRYFTVLPVADTSGIVKVLDREIAPISRFDYILQEHNEHRIVFTKAILLCDYYFLGGLKIFPQILLFFINAACLLFFLRVYRDETKENSLLWICSLSALFLGLMQLRNFDSVFQLQFFIVNLSAAFAFFSFGKFYEKLTSEKNTEAIKWFLFSLIGAVLASFNMGNGLLAPVVLCIGVVVLTRNWKYSIVCILITALTWFLYFKDYDANRSTELQLTNPKFYWNCILYVVYFVGNIFQLRFPHRIDVLAFAIVGTSLGAYFVLETVFNSKKRSATRIFAVLTMLFVVLSAAAAASGRLEAGFKQALTTRYCTTTILYWAALLSLCFSLAKTKRTRLLVNIFAVFVLAAAIKRQTQVIHYASVEGEKRDMAETSIKAGMTDMRLISWAMPFYTQQTIDILTARSLSIYNPVHWNASAYEFDLGELQESELGFSISGIKEFEDKQSNTSGLVLFGGFLTEEDLDREFYLVNSNGKLIGVGTKIKYRQNFPDHHKREDFIGRWIAYFNGDLSDLSSAQIVSKSGLLGRHKLHKFEYQYFAGVEVVHFTKEPKAFPVVDVDFWKHPETSWFDDGYYPHLPISAPEVKILGTWHETFGDSKRGLLEIELDDVPGEFDQFVLPVLFGPDSSTATIRIEYKNADSPVFFDLKNKPSHVWIYLDLSRFISADKDFKLIVEDGGTGFGQWVAVGKPLSHY